MSQQHIVRAFDAELNELRSHIATMGGIAETMLIDSVQALRSFDPEKAQRVIVSDAKLDTLQRDVEERGILVIARRQPMAVDLREIVSAIRVAGDLERVGDLAKNVAKRALVIAGQAPAQRSRALIGLGHLTDIVGESLKDVLDAYNRNDLDQALSVWNRDDSVDALYTSLFRELLTYMMEDPRNITFCTHLLFCAKNIERIGDHATNIAETLHYKMTGTPLTGDRPKGDNTAVTVESDT
jgi:phosphate transport system protein